jgi:glutamate-1-semialdehyde 2,1-aminomutase
VWDVEGHKLIDMVQSYGAILLGHGHPAVTEALADAAVRGTSFGAPTTGEVHLAEAIVARVPGCEQVRLVSSGTEAAMSAVRVARGYTGRDRVVKFDGCYHGHSDTLLAGGGSGVAALGLSGSAGVPLSAVAETLVVPYGQIPDLDDRVACIIVEPVAANMGLVDPDPEFLSGLRKACDDNGTLLIFDEVITGFRLGESGSWGHSGVTADLWCFGKVIGGGLPVGAFGGRSDVLSVLAPDGPVYQAGTLSGNPMATAAGLAVLSSLGAADYELLGDRVSGFGEELSAAIGSAGLAVQVPVVGPLVGLFFAEEPVRNYEDARRSAENGLYARFFAAMLRRGVALAPGPYEVMFPGFAHGQDLLSRVADIASEAAADVVSEGLSK